jgi:uncharacterized protein YndB with AHSA1/START domain
MIAPDGAVFPNHHLYVEVLPEERIVNTLLWGEHVPKHACAWASLEDQDGATKITLSTVFSTAVQFQDAKGFGAVELGLQTPGNWNTLSYPAECGGGERRPDHRRISVISAARTVGRGRQ